MSNTPAARHIKEGSSGAPYIDNIRTYILFRNAIGREAICGRFGGGTGVHLANTRVCVR